MLEGLTEEEADTFLQENPTLVPLYEIDVVKEAEPYQLTEEAAIVELGRAREALRIRHRNITCSLCKHVQGGRRHP
jgi:hypothetical protein